MQDTPLYKILFVCTGNICRSPTAEGIFRKHLENHGLETRVHVDSAATHAYHIGNPPDPRSIEAALSRGYDLRGLRARKVSEADFLEYDLLLAMDRGHLKILRKLAPEGHLDKAALFLEYTGGGNFLDVPDPYYGSMKDFYHVIDIMEKSSESLLKSVQLALERH